MTDIPAIKILVVDDLAEKLLVYQSILESPGVEIVLARSGAEALGRLLNDEFAVILLDVNMPDMDGYETASMIRARKRCAHSPIIFITAHADELHEQKGYDYGAVDYILTPVVPAVLRTKVRVFVDLYRKTLEMQRQGELVRELQAREHQRQLWETKERLKLALEAGRMGAVEWDMGARILSWSPDLETIFGFAPGEFKGEARELEKRVHQDDHDRVMRGLLDAVKHDGEFRIEHRILRGGDKSAVAWVELRGKVFAADRGRPGRLVGVCMDITERWDAQRAIDESERRLRAMFGQMAVGFALLDLEGRFVELNQRLGHILGRESEALKGLSWQDLTHPDDWTANEAAIHQVASGERAHCGLEKRYRRADGSWLWVNVTLSPLLDNTGRVHRLIKVVEDISARKKAEVEITRHREHLEQLIRERTSELAASHERLRLADRLASIGTLAAGLGHDMGNLLFPVRTRLASLKTMSLPPAAKNDLEAIETASEYLKRLSQGLRLFALDPAQAGGLEATALPNWWLDVEPFLRNTLPKGVVLAGDFPPDVGAVAVAPHTLTQIVYNLVQNAGDAMRGHASGTVTVGAHAVHEPGSIVLFVRDDGPGMSEEVRTRCLEPFFTTRKRQISTGLGLALVHAAVSKVGGKVEIISGLGKGTEFLLTVPTPPSAHPATEGSTQRRPRTACICLRDARIAAYVSTLLRGVEIDVSRSTWSAALSVDVVVVDASSTSDEAMRLFLSGDALRRAIVCGPASDRFELEGVTWVNQPCSPSQMRTAISRALGATVILAEEALS